MCVCACGCVRLCVCPCTLDCFLLQSYSIMDNILLGFSLYAVLALPFSQCHQLQSFRANWPWAQDCRQGTLIPSSSSCLPLFCLFCIHLLVYSTAATTCTYDWSVGQHLVSRSAFGRFVDLLCHMWWYELWTICDLLCNLLLGNMAAAFRQSIWTDASTLQRAVMQLTCFPNADGGSCSFFSLCDIAGIGFCTMWGGVQSRMQWMCGHFFCNNFHIVHLTICIVIWKEAGGWAFVMLCKKKT